MKRTPDDVAPGQAAKAERQPAHRWHVRIYYEDTDAGGIVYYANYLKFAERARTEMMRDFGIEQRAWREATGLSFVVHHCSIDYRRPARLDDVIEVRTYIEKAGGASLSLVQDVHLDETHLVSINVRLALIDQKMRPVRLPKALIAALTPQYRVGD